MSFVDKLKFWKTDEPDFGDLESGIEQTSAPRRVGYDEDFNDNLGLDVSDKRLGMGQSSDDEEQYNMQQSGQITKDQTIRGPSIGRELPTPYEQASSRQQGGVSGADYISKDLEIISAKIELIKVSLESMNQRLINIEKKLENQEKRW